MPTFRILPGSSRLRIRNRSSDRTITRVKLKIVLDPHGPLPPMDAPEMPVGVSESRDTDIHVSESYNLQALEMEVHCEGLEPVLLSHVQMQGNDGVGECIITVFENVMILQTWTLQNGNVAEYYEDHAVYP